MPSSSIQPCSCAICQKRSVFSSCARHDGAPLSGWHGRKRKQSRLLTWSAKRSFLLRNGSRERSFASTGSARRMSATARFASMRRCV